MSCCLSCLVGGYRVVQCAKSMEHGWAGEVVKDELRQW